MAKPQCRLCTIQVLKTAPELASKVCKHCGRFEFVRAVERQVVASFVWRRVYPGLQARDHAAAIPIGPEYMTDVVDYSAMQR